MLQKFHVLLFSPHAALAINPGDREMTDDDTLTSMMNGPVRNSMGNTIPSGVSHSLQKDRVFKALRGDFMKPVTTVGKSFKTMISESS